MKCDLRALRQLQRVTKPLKNSVAHLVKSNDWKHAKHVFLLPSVCARYVRGPSIPVNNPFKGQPLLVTGAEQLKLESHREDGIFLTSFAAAHWAREFAELEIDDQFIFLEALCGLHHPERLFAQGPLSLMHLAFLKGVRGIDSDEESFGEEEDDFEEDSDDDDDDDDDDDEEEEELGDGVAKAGTVQPLLDVEVPPERDLKLRGDLRGLVDALAVEE